MQSSDSHMFGPASDGHVRSSAGLDIRSGAALRVRDAMERIVARIVALYFSPTNLDDFSLDQSESTPESAPLQSTTTHMSGRPSAAARVLGIAYSMLVCSKGNRKASESPESGAYPLFA